MNTLNTIQIMVTTKLNMKRLKNTELAFGMIKYLDLKTLTKKLILSGRKILLFKL